MKYIKSESKDGFYRTYWKTRLGIEGIGDFENEWLNGEEISAKAKEHQERIKKLR